VNRLAHKPELRNDDTILAYLEELVRLGTPVQFWLPQAAAVPFETTLQQVSPGRFSTRTTPLLETGQSLHMAFMLDARRFTGLTQVLGTGVFRVPASIAHGERRAHPRGAFDRFEKAEVFALERLHGTIAGGRTIVGKLLELSSHGLRLTLEAFDVVSGPVAALEPGDRFDLVRVSGLPHMPAIQCGGRLAHLTGTTAGLALDGFPESDLKNLERILAPRFPPAFGLDFPSRKRKADEADRPGPPTPTRVKVKPAEVVERALERPAPEPEPPRAPDPPAIRIRKAARRILLLSAQGSTHALAAAFREDGFRHVHEARSFREVQDLCAELSFDLLLLDNTMSGHWAKDMMKALRGHQLLLDTPVVLVVECDNQISQATAEALEAVHIHERRASYLDLLPVVCRVLLS
jgi:CheY-like chemotaxis protein